uniref:ATP synthase complex subunit 8 n=1 Tax=Lathrobium brunnipes TaxID=346787 RepID=A0A0S2M7U3_9COLE|nr:ATP synthase F0 subunit 8 [Lathrobium brunnipes]
MPQMAPLSWLLLFMLFTLIFLSFNFINYYMFLYKSKNTKTNKNYFKMNWKW